MKIMRGETVEVKCLCCNKATRVRVADRKRGWGKFCSRSCANVYRISTSKDTSFLLEAIANQYDQIGINIEKALKRDDLTEAQRCVLIDWQNVVDKHFENDTKENYGQYFSEILKGVGSE